MEALKAKLNLVRTGQGNFGATLQGMATRVCMFAFSVCSGIVTARTLGAEGRGELAALITWPQFIAYLLTFGVINSFVYNVKKAPQDKSRLFGTALVLSLLVGAIASIVGIVLMPVLLSGYTADIVRIAQYLMLLSPIILLALTVQTAAEAAADFQGANILRGLSVAGTFSMCILLALSGEITPLSAALSYTLPQIPLTLWLLARLRPHYGPALAGFKTAAGQLLRYGLRCYPVELVTAASGYAGQAMVVALVKPAFVGYFMVSLSISKLLEIFHTAVASVLLPATAARSLSEVADKTARAARLTLVLMASFGIPLVMILPLALPLVYGGDFVEAVPIARLLVLEAVLSGTVWVLIQAFLALGRPELATISQLVPLGLSVVLLLVFVPEHGALAAAKILLIAAAVKLTIVLGLYRFALGVPVRGLLYSRDDVSYVEVLLRR